MARVTFKVNTDKLNCDADQILSDVKKIGSDIEQANQEINSLSTMWKGEANAALVENFNEAYGWMESVLSRIESFANKLADDASEYNVCESKVSDLVSNI